MNKVSKKFLWIFLAVVIVLGLLWQYYPLPTGQAQLNALPILGATFAGKDVPLTSFEEDFFKKVNLIKRIYRIRDRDYFVTVLDGSHNRHAVHDPYYCFRGAGWVIDNEKPFPLPRGTGSELQITKDRQSREALFWFSDVSKQYSSPLEYWWQTTLRRMTLGLSGPEPLLIMIQPLTNQKVDWHQVLQQFQPLQNI